MDMDKAIDLTPMALNDPGDEAIWDSFNQMFFYFAASNRARFSGLKGISLAIGIHFFKCAPESNNSSTGTDAIYD